jgi:hypothetical protein
LHNWDSMIREPDLGPRPNPSNIPGHRAIHRPGPG